MKLAPPNQLAVFAALIILFTVSCDEGQSEEEEIKNNSEPTIIGEWFFTESTIEIINVPDDSNISISAPDVTGIKWTFLENDSLFVEAPDTSWMERYFFRSSTMELVFENGMYDVMKLTADSLNLRFYSDLSDLSVEFYVHNQLVR